MLALSRCGQKDPGKEVGAADEAAKKEHEEAGGGPLGVIGDEWMTLTRRVSNPAAATSASLPTRRHATRTLGSDAKAGTWPVTGHGSGSVRGSPRDAIELPYRPMVPVRAEAPLVVSVEGVSRKQGATAVLRRGSGESGMGHGGGATAGVDVFDISRSDDDDNAENGDEQLVTASNLVSSSAGGLVGGRADGSRDGVRAPVGEGFGTGEGRGAARCDGRNTKPWRSATFFKSLSRAGASSESGALDWSSRACPAWLQEEVDSGTVKASGKRC